MQISHSLIVTALLLIGVAGTSGSSNSTKNTGENQGSQNEVDISELPLEDICQLVGISKENCTCANYPFFCPTKEDKHEFTCDRYYDIIEGIVKVSASGLGLIGNTVVLVITYKSWKNMIRFRQLIGLLALADFIFSAFEIANAIPLFWTCKWIYSLFWCKFFKGALNLGGIFALALITVIALERYVAITQPFARQKSRIPFWFWPLLALVLSIASVIPMVVVLDIDRDNLCVEVWDKNSNSSLIYSWYLLIATFLLPMVVIVYFYYGLVKFVLMSTRNSAAIQNNDNMIQRRNKNNKRIIIILFAVAFAFFILVLPNRVVWIVLDTMGTNSLSQSTYRILKYVCVFPYLFHVSINPIIYSFVDKKFQKDVFRFFSNMNSTIRKISSSSGTNSTVVNTFNLSQVLRRISRSDDEGGKIDRSSSSSSPELGLTTYTA